MSTRVSTKQKLLSELESADSVLRDLSAILSKRQSLNLEPLVELLLEKEGQIKRTLCEVETQCEIQRKIDTLRSDCIKSDKQISACQLQLKKAEVLLSTALYYSRQKLDSMAKAVKNPIDVDDLVRFAHRISASHGVSAPDNWVQGDPRRPYPNREEIRSGYLGHLDDMGQFRPSLWDALSETVAAANLANCSISSATCTPMTTGGTVGSTLHPPATETTNRSVDPLSLSGSPNMILPGVNMVSSPVTLQQSNAAAQVGPETPVPTIGALRTTGVSLAAMLERSALQPPSLRPTPEKVMPPTIKSSLGHRSAFALSPGAAGLAQPLQTDSNASIQSPRSSFNRHTDLKRRIEETEPASSETSSDSSSGDD